MKRTTAPFLMLLLGVLCCAGCLKANKDFVINPDGSGKVTVEETAPNLATLMDPSDKHHQSNEDVRKFVAQVFEGSTGIDAWKDVSYKLLPDGQIHFKGTAYFRDINTLKFSQLSNSDLRFERSEGGAMVLKLSPPEKSKDDDRPILTGAELDHMADSLRQAFQETRRMLEAIGDIYEHINYRIAGTLGDVQGFKRDTNGTISIELEGRTLLRTIDSLTSAPGYWRGVAAGGPNEDSDVRMITAVFGGSLPRAEVRPGATPLFDYAAEVAAAGKGYAALRKKVGVK